MKIVEALLNRSEAMAFSELEKIASDNGWRVFSKTRLSDVIAKGGSYLSQREFDYFTRCHFDYVITDAVFRPLMAVEYDGPLHADARQKERDDIKNALCRRAGLGLLRIHDRHVTKLYRGKSVLRWIIEVSELAKAFDEAQRNGQIPMDEPFDPALFDPINGGIRFPYWLSAPATRSIHDFFATFNPAVPHGWTSFVSYDAERTAYKLSCLYFDEQVLWTRTAVRNQDLDFPHYELLNEINSCDLGISLAKFRRGEMRAITKAEFRPVFERFCERYDPHPAHSMGSFPFEGVWDIKKGWRSR